MRTITKKKAAGLIEKRRVILDSIRTTALAGNCQQCVKYDRAAGRSERYEQVFKNMFDALLFVIP